MTFEIVLVGDPVLRMAARALSAEDIAAPETQELIEHMRETMRAAPGVGLAAPQIGLALQLAVIEDRPEYMKDITAEKLAARGRCPVEFLVLINPRIVERSGEEIAFFEGCLSLPGHSAVVKRARRVTVEYLDAQGRPQRLEAEGWPARILQHEIDHLLGHLYIDRMNPRTFTTIANLNRNP